MIHVSFNPTLECNIRCPYCWLDEAGVDRSVLGLPAQTWIDWLESIAQPLAVDICGGEPLLYDGLSEIIRFAESGIHRWAITTNLTLPSWELLKQPFHYNNIINISYHDRDFFFEQVDRAEYIRAAGNTVGWNFVQDTGEDYTWPLSVLEAREFKVNWTPYAAPLENYFEEQGWKCDGGHKSLWLAPNGDVYRCWTHVKSKASPVGSILHDFIGQPMEHIPCGLVCELPQRMGCCGVKVWR